MDMRRLKDQEEEQKQEEEDDEGDTDSLMEWWNTVESWDEIPPDETIRTKEEETISFKAVADKVHRGLRVYLKLFMERAELLYQHVLILYGIADDLSNFHHRAKIANITGGTTTAVGGAAAIAGLALVPVTFGASIIISAIGLGVATAGGITAASASISDTINNMHDRKKIEIIIMDYEAQLVEMQHCLRFVIEGLCRLRSHPLLRRNNYYTGDWEVRRALQTISLVSDPVDRAEELIHRTLAKLASLQKGIDKYFTKDSKEVKKGCKKEVTAEVRILAKQLHEGLAELNSIREQLLDASGNI
uniref:Si:cabz01007807.1 n=1 Tax=Cyprinus carpio TaxID=7962 RepID=A0A8C1WVD9_CYPCA